MIPAMDEVGKRFECNEYFVPELLIAARAMKTSLELITPLLAEAGAEPVGPGGDRHRPGRPARHRQEPRGLDARRRRIPGGRPRRGRAAREVRRSRQGEGRHDRRPLRPADHHHDDDEDRHRRPGEGRHPQADQGDDRRRPDHPAVRRRDRRRRLQRQRQRGRGPGRGNAWRATAAWPTGSDCSASQWRT